MTKILRICALSLFLVFVTGTAWADEARPYLPKGPSGVAVRTLANLAFETFEV